MLDVKKNTQSHLTNGGIVHLINEIQTSQGLLYSKHDRKTPKRNPEMNKTDRSPTISSDRNTLSVRPEPQTPLLRYPLRIFLTLSIILGSLPASTISPDEVSFYLVSYVDKQSDSELDLLHPQDFLSTDALLRRRRGGVRVDSLDLPLSANYLEQVRPFFEEERYHLRWLNASLVLMTVEDAAFVERFPFVTEVKKVGEEEFGESPLSNLRRRSSDAQPAQKPELTDDFHGYAAQQSLEVRGDCLHQRGFNGRGRTIAVLDGGFSRLHQIPFFDTLQERGGILHKVDLVEDDTTVNHGSGHGSQVLSILAANIPGLMVGSAPGADYLLYRTESARHQACLEELNWAYAVEQADSLGADIISSSLGYEFGSGGCQEVPYSNQAARVAVQKGLLIISSAGNGGTSQNHLVQRPANEPGVLAIGSTDPDGDHSAFSSFGAVDDQVKPELVAPGEPTMVASLYDLRVNEANGTSFSAPLVAGFAACLWQAHPNATNTQILEALRRSSPAADRPDRRTGYGKPDFAKAYSILGKMVQERKL